ncbi:MAG: hypothetical protein IT443_13505 [Phycisphaeraceae bacterium]|nr:hypothetical protein [Phycisphaeraceae bacterium]
MTKRPVGQIAKQLPHKTILQAAACLALLLLITATAYPAEKTRPPAPGSGNANNSAPAAGKDAKSAPPAKTDELLSTERWQEQDHGVSLRPPLGSQLQQFTANGALLRISGGKDYSVEVYLRKIESGEELAPFTTSGQDPNSKVTHVTEETAATPQLDIEAVVEMALKQVKVAHPEATTQAQSRPTLGGKPGAILYFNLPGSSGQAPLVLGHGYMLIDGQSFLMMRLVALQSSFSSVQPLFEAVLASLQIEDPAQRDKQRAELIARSQSFLSSLTSTQLRQAVIPEQWFRVTSANQDVGYLRVTQAGDQKMGYSGLSVEIQAHYETGGQIVDSLGQMFLSDDRQHEIWSTRTTVRVADAKPQPKDSPAPERKQTIAETGVRSGSQITITREDASSAKKFTWETPPQGYLSQVEIYLLPAVIPHDSAQKLGFYAYYPATGSIAYRTVDVKPLDNQQYALVIQPSPNHANETSIYNAKSQLVERTLPSPGGTTAGQKILPTTREQIVSLWKLKP